MATHKGLGINQAAGRTSSSTHVIPISTPQHVRAFTFAVNPTARAEIGRHRLARKRDQSPRHVALMRPLTRKHEQMQPAVDTQMPSIDEAP